MGAKLDGGDEDGITDINITPFVDIILVVLIIFIVTTSEIVKQSIKVTLPDAATGESTQSTSLGLLLDKDGGLFIDGEAATTAQLRTLIRSEKTKNKDVVCLIGADTATPHGKVMALVDLVKQEGVAKFAFNINPVGLPEDAPAAEPVEVAP